MPRLSVPAMVAAARRFGLTVEVVPGAQTRGSANFNPVVFVGHHTAGAKTGVRPTLNICVNGRPGLAGPLCNWFLDRNGVCIIVAAGVANHAGKGSFRGISGNSRAQGCEAEDDGDGNWAPVQLWAYPRLVAAGLYLMRRDETWYCSHRTWTPRKIDPTGISDDWMRTRVREVTADRTITHEEGLSMADVKAITDRLDKINATLVVTNGILGVIVRGDPNKPGAEETHPGNMEDMGEVLRDILAELTKLSKVLTPTGGAS